MTIGATATRTTDAQRLATMTRANAATATSMSWSAITGGTARDRVRDDPRDVLLDGLDLPRGLEREVVWDHEHTYELNGDDSRSLATVGAFRVVPDSDLLDPRSESLDHLRDEGLVATIPLDERDRGVVLTDRGRRAPGDAPP